MAHKQALLLKQLTVTVVCSAVTVIVFFLPGAGTEPNKAAFCCLVLPQSLLPIRNLPAAAHIE